ncbi:MAG: hypothetical protein GF307_10140 [candidate division Zixibacteria bacterium]|nr:hypothetical protein [candidate division Zixibacteria bacterium]
MGEGLVNRHITRSIVISIIIFTANYYPAIAIEIDRLIPVEDYTPSSECGQCHRQVYSEWRGSIHNSSHLDIIYQADLGRMVKAEGVAAKRICVACHAPLAALAGLDGYAEEKSLPLEARLGIGCDFCHTIDGNFKDGGIVYDFFPGETKYGPSQNLSDAPHPVKYSAFQNSSEYCALCHDTDHILAGENYGGTYTQWKYSKYNRVDSVTTCQDCHMSFDLISSGPRADSIEHSNHYFTAANTAYPGLIGTPVHNSIAVESLRRAANIKVAGIKEIGSGEEYIFWVTVHNKGAGHLLPTGLPGLRQIWLSIRILDSNTRELLYSNGEVDSLGVVDTASCFIGADYVDANGEVTDKVWEAAGVINDNRIPPGETSRFKYSYKIPEDYKGEMVIFAMLNYRSAKQDFINEIFNETPDDMAVVQMDYYIHKGIKVR